MKALGKRTSGCFTFTLELIAVSLVTTIGGIPSDFIQTQNWFLFWLLETINFIL